MMVNDDTMGTQLSRGDRTQGCCFSVVDLKVRTYSAEHSDTFDLSLGVQLCTTKLHEVLHTTLGTPATTDVDVVHPTVPAASICC
jgi:hypothetical protein